MACSKANRKVYVNIPRKYHNRKAQHSLETSKEEKDEEQIRTEQTPNIQPQRHKQRRTAIKKKKKKKKKNALERSERKLLGA